MEQDLSAERAQLEVARNALIQRDFAAALVVVDAHAARFPRGALTEERESLRIQAVAGAGQRDEAAHLADRFRKRYPASIFEPAVDTALRRAQ
jgi:outer membrane protein assembly factor BamD (BamD/ComL family)